MTLHKLDSRLLLLGEHCYLDSTDDCYFTHLYECRRRVGVRSEILALKRNQTSAIMYFTRELSSALPSKWASGYTFVPMPPASGLSSPVKSIVKELPVKDTRDLLLQNVDTPCSHNGWRLSPVERVEFLVVNELATHPKPRAVVIVDDVLTTGAHYRASKKVLRTRWPGLNVLGLFIARVCSRTKGRCCLEEKRQNVTGCCLGQPCPDTPGATWFPEQCRTSAERVHLGLNPHADSKDAGCSVETIRSSPRTVGDCLGGTIV